MPKLTKTSLQRSQSVTAKLTVEEEILLREAAEREDLTPSGYARKVLLSSLRSTETERLLLAKLCKIESMMQQFFGGLFTQLNEKKTFGGESFKAVVAKADSTQYQKADELLTAYATLRRSENGQNGSGNHA
jgi:hypothetical protein